MVVSPRIEYFSLAFAKVGGPRAGEMAFTSATNQWGHDASYGQQIGRFRHPFFFLVRCGISDLKVPSANNNDDGSSLLGHRSSLLAPGSALVQLVRHGDLSWSIRMGVESFILVQR